MKDLFQKYVDNWYRTYYEYADSQLYIQFHITRLCESRCPHCYFKDLESIKNTLSLEECKHVIDDIAITARKLDKKALIDFTGGDPLLHPEIDKILEYSRTRGVSTGLKCNSHLLFESTIEKLKKLNVERVYLSLEGLKNTNDTIRGQGDFERTINAISLLKEKGLYTRVHMTLSNLNMHEVIPLMEFFIKHKFVIDVFSWSRFWSKNNTKAMINSTNFKNILDEQLEILKKFYNSDDFYVTLENGITVPRISFEFKEHIWFPYLCEKGEIDQQLIEDLSAIKNSINCTSTRHVYIIDNNGDVLKCRKLPEFTIGNIFEESLYNITKNTKNINCEKLGTKSDCGKCKYFNVCAGCPAIASSKGLSIFTRDPDCFLKI